MKTKYWVIASHISCLFILFTGVIVPLTSQKEASQQTLIFAFIATIAFCVIVVTLTMCIPKANKIDNLEEEQKKTYEKGEEFLRLKRLYIKLIEKATNEPI